MCAAFEGHVLCERSGRRCFHSQAVRTNPPPKAPMWLRSLLISALSACLAVWTTLQYQAWVDRRPSPLSEDDSPKIAPRKTEQAEPAEPAEQAEQAEPAIQASSIAVKVDQGEVVVEPPTVEASEDTAVHGSLGAELVAAGDVDEGIRVLEAETSADAYNAYNLGVAWQSKVRAHEYYWLDSRGSCRFCSWSYS